MIGAGAAAGMALVSLGMVLTPGPNMVYLVSRSIGQGRRAGWVSLAGTVCGFGVYLTAAALGLASVFVVVPWLYVGVKIAGAMYLLWLAISTLRPGGASVFEMRAVRPDPPRRLFAAGLTTNLLNPKAAVMYLSLLPQFIEPRAGHVVTQEFLLGGIQISLSAAVNAALIAAAGGIATFLRARPDWSRWQRRVTGTLLGAVAIKLAIDSPKPASL